MDGHKAAQAHPWQVVDKTGKRRGKPAGPASEPRTGAVWRNTYLVGQLYRWAGEDPRAAALTLVQYSVLEAAVSFVGGSQGAQADPTLTATRAVIADRARVGVRAVASALKVLCDAGLLKHTGGHIVGSDGHRKSARYDVLIVRELITAKRRSYARGARQ